MISLGENYKHSALIPLKSLGVLPFISMGVLPSPYNGRSHLSAGIGAAPLPWQLWDTQIPGKEVPVGQTWGVIAP